MVELVAVDNGRSRNKTFCRRGTDIFRSVLGEYHPLHLERALGNGDMVVEYKDTAYFVGEIAAEESHAGSQMMLKSKVHQDTKILTLCALHRTVPDGSNVTLVVGEPIENHTPSEKLRMKQLLLGEHRIKVNGTEKSFDVTRVEVAAECASVGWFLKRTDRYHVVDVGSRTVNFVTMNGTKWINRLSGSLDYGFETLGVSKQMFARTTIAELSRRLNTLLPIVLIGGAAPILFDYFREYTSDIELHANPTYANAQAFYELGVKALETGQEKSKLQHS